MSKPKLTTVRLSGQLGKRFGKVHKFLVSTPAEAVKMLAVNFDGFEHYLGVENQNTRYKVFVADTQIDPQNDLHTLSGTQEIRIAPVIAGAKNSGLFNVILGAALIALAWYNPMGWVALGEAGAVGTTALFSAGMSLVMGGVAALLSPQPKLDIAESPENKPSANFAGPVNTTAAGYPTPVAYGRVMAGSAVVSAGIYAEDTSS